MCNYLMCLFKAGNLRNFAVSLSRTVSWLLFSHTVGGAKQTYCQRGSRQKEMQLSPGDENDTARARTLPNDSGSCL